MFKRKFVIGVIAIAAIGLIAAIGGYAYWSVQQQLTANQIASGHMAIQVDDTGTGTAATALNVAGLMPGQSGSKQYTITSVAGNPNVDLWFAVENVADNGTLADNVNVAFLLQTTPDTAYWLLPSGALHPFNFASTLAAEEADPAHYSDMRSFNASIWSGITGYQNIASGPTSARHITAYYNLPLDCANDCHDCVATFDMTFGLSQTH